MMAAPGAAAPAEEAEVQTEFKLIIVDCAADKRIGAIKVVRSLTTLGLKEAKDAVTTLPFTILENKPKAEVRDMQGARQRAPPQCLTGRCGCLCCVRTSAISGSRCLVQEASRRRRGSMPSVCSPSPPL